MIVEIFLDRVNGSLAVQGVEDSFDQQHVDAALDEPVDGLGIGGYETVEGDVAEAGVVDVGRDGRRAVGWTQGAGDEAGFAGRLGGRCVGGHAG